MSEYVNQYRRPALNSSNLMNSASPNSMVTISIDIRFSKFQNWAALIIRAVSLSCDSVRLEMANEEIILQHLK